MGAAGAGVGATAGEGAIATGAVSIIPVGAEDEDIVAALADDTPFAGASVLFSGGDFPIELRVELETTFLSAAGIWLSSSTDKVFVLLSRAASIRESSDDMDDTVTGLFEL